MQPNYLASLIFCLIKSPAVRSSSPGLEEKSILIDIAYQ
jgi:hypothetical protein